METQLLHRGRLVDHIQLVVADLAASRAFYGAIFDVLGVPVGGEAEDYFWASSGVSGAAVDGFYYAGLAAGGRDNGAPGERPYHPGYYAAFLLDPDGNNIEAVYHGAHQRSAPSVEIRFEG
jgi:catechol 2,3-dioxygenase-like lactoylglutathione lyase family enzyme